MTIEQLRQEAIRQHMTGHLPEAEKLYRQIIGLQPEDAEVLHLLGVIANQTGRYDTAVEMIGQAIAVKPNFSEAYNNLGVSLKAKGEYEEAIAAYRRAITLKPDYARAHCNLGNALWEKGELDEAITACREAITLKPDYAEAYNNLGNALKDKRQVGEAITAYRQAVALRPNLPDVHNNLGNALKDHGKPDESIAAYRQAIALRPAYFEAYNNLGNALVAMGELEAGIVAYRQAIAFKSDYAAAWSNLGNALLSRGELDEAIAACRKAIAAKPEYVEAYNHLGNALTDQGQLNEAIAAYQQAITLRPETPQTHNNLGNALKEAGQLDSALTAYRRALALAQAEGNPIAKEFHSNICYTVHFHPGYDERRLFQECRHWNQLYAEPLKDTNRLHANDRNPDRVLKIGYVSPDFSAHAESFFVVPLLKAHDHREFEIHCYASVKRPDTITTRLRQSADAWHDVLDRSDAALADQIRGDQIDILIDLTMHMAGNRLALFVRKPAPVQMTWLAYPGTTGLSAIDYRITDAFMDPHDADMTHYSEQSIRLPNCWVCYDPLAEAPSAAAREPSPDSPITFGSLNNPCKLNDQQLQLWAKVLQVVPDSRLIVLAGTAGQREGIQHLFNKAGINSGRLEFVGYQKRNQYLRVYDRIDIALDTLPYNGITTTCDALWMGVPVITLAGQTAAGRAGLAMLTCLGHPELVANTAQQFVEIAATLAGDVPRLRQLRSTLREKLVASPLMDAEPFARGIESAYRQAWRKWCSNQGS